MLIFVCAIKRTNLQKWSRLAQQSRTALDAMNSPSDGSGKDEEGTAKTGDEGEGMENTDAEQSQDEKEPGNQGDGSEKKDNQEDEDEQQQAQNVEQGEAKESDKEASNDAL